MASPLPPLPSPTADIVRERNRASFPVRELTYLLDGGAAVTERKVPWRDGPAGATRRRANPARSWDCAGALSRTKERIRRLVAQEPVFDYTQRPFLARTDRFAAGVAMVKRMMELKREHNLSADEFDDLREAVGEIHPCATPPLTRSASRSPRGSPPCRNVLLRRSLQDAHPRVRLHAGAADAGDRRAAGQVPAARGEPGPAGRVRTNRAGPRTCSGRAGAFRRGPAHSCPRPPRRPCAAYAGLQRARPANDGDVHSGGRRL